MKSPLKHDLKGEIFDFKVLSSFLMRSWRMKLLVWSGVLCATHAVAAGPGPLTGLYRVSELGTVDFVVQDGRSIGRFKDGGVCGFAPDTPIVTGTFEGTVFVGSAVVCQAGPSCEKTKTVPFLGVWHDEGLVGSIKLDASCSSPALENHRLVFSLAGAAPKAAKTVDTKDLFNNASAKLNSGDFAGARDQFVRVLAQDDPTFALGARVGLGVAQVNLKEYASAMDNLEKASILAQRLKADEVAAEALFNLACAQAQLGLKRDAIGAARKAVSLGKPGQYVDQLEHDNDLASLRDDPEFRKLTAEARFPPKRRPSK